jgi:hypothetical protein
VTIAIALVLAVIVNVSGRPFVTVAVIGMINDFPAGTATFPIGAITGAANNNPATDRKKHTARHFATVHDFLFDLLFMSCARRFTRRCAGLN